MEDAKDQASLVAEDAMASDVDNSGDLDSTELSNAMSGVLGDVLSEKDPENIIKTHDQDDSGTLDHDEIKKAVIDTNESRQTGLNEWGDE